MVDRIDYSFQFSVFILKKCFDYKRKLIILELWHFHHINL